MSPEHALGRQVTPATDIFALGLIAAVAATGRHPYGDGAGISIAASIANTPQQAPDLSGYPDRLRPLLERCLAADAAQRPGPAELAEWCQRAAGRPLRDLQDWLPAGLAAEIARREQLSQSPPQMPSQTPSQTPPPPSYNPTYVPTQAASGPGGPIQQGHPMQGTPGPHAALHGAATATAPVPVPSPHAPPAPYPAPPNRGRGRVPLIVGAGVLAVVLAAGGTWYLTRADDKGGTEAKGGDKAADQPMPASSESQPQASMSAQAQTPAAPAYTVVFKDKSLKLLAPREFGKFNDVDLDFPKVAPFGEISSGNRELQMGYEALESRTTFGKSLGPAPEQCATGAATNPIPDKLNSDALTGADSTIVRGDLLCTVTSKGNLAMVKIVGIEPSTSKQYDIPTYLTEVTLWKPQS